MNSVEKILSKQHAQLNFTNGKVEYFSISTQWGEANTVEEAIENILVADKKYNGKAPVTHWIEKTYKLTEQDIYNEAISCEELERIVEEFNKIPN